MRWLQEPLIGFALLSLVIFGIAEWREGTGESSQRGNILATGYPPQKTITITPQVRASLLSDYSWLHGRDATDEEVSELLERWVDEEILFREAVAAGLPANDPKTRHRMIDIVRQLWSSRADDPADHQLLDYYLEHIENYYQEPMFSFDHRFFEPTSAIRADVKTSLERTGEPAGDPFWMPDHAASYPESILRISFGGEFFGALQQAPIGQWFGPIETRRGNHFVRLKARTPSTPQPFRDVRPQVLDDWHSATRLATIEARLTELRSSYGVVDATQTP